MRESCRRSPFRGFLVSNSQIDSRSGLSGRIQAWLGGATPFAFSTYAICAAFCTYFCMYAFRKPFKAAEFEGDIELPVLGGMNYKILLILAQIIGYTLSKFIGIKVISEMKPMKRAWFIVFFITWAELALLGFAMTPRPWSVAFLFLNGLPLGMIWGLVFGFLEGRRVSEALGAGLSASYILADDVVTSVGDGLVQSGVTEAWMPFCAGALFYLPMMIFVWMLSLLPQPNAEDEAARVRRVPMNGASRRAFLKRFLPGMVSLIFLYMFLTAYRDFRSNFGKEIWTAVGYEKAPEVFALSSIPVAFGVMIALGLVVRIKDNRRALMVIHGIMLAGSILIGLSTALYQLGWIGPFPWMVLVGLGLYLGYVPYGCVLFDRLIASVGLLATAGFMIYVTDAFGYLGSIGILLYKNFGAPELSWLDFFIKFSYITSVVCSLFFLYSMAYFRRASRQAVEADDGA